VQFYLLFWFCAAPFHVAACLYYYFVSTVGDLLLFVLAVGRLVLPLLDIAGYCWILLASCWAHFTGRFVATIRRSPWETGRGTGDLGWILALDAAK